MTSDETDRGDVTHLETIDRTTADREHDHDVVLYRRDDEIFTYDELREDCEAEARTIPDESWEGGEFNFDDYIIDSCLVGIYHSVAVVATIVTQYTDGNTRWTYDQMREQVFPDLDRGDLSFEDWLAESTNAGTFKPIAILQYTDEWDEVVAERRIIG
jgi:hypothetical protein